MPMYTYECQQCGHIWTDLGTFEESTKSCPKTDLHGDAPGENGEYVPTGKRIPSLPAPAVFNCPMPTAPTKHHRHGRGD